VGADTSKERFVRELDGLLAGSPLSTKGISDAARRHGIGYSTLQSWRTGEHLPRVPEDNPALVAFVHEVAAAVDDAERLLAVAVAAWRESVRARKTGPASASFVGRQAQREVLGGHLRVPGSVVVIWGPGGRGKTSLAHRLLGDNTAGRQCLRVDMRGSGPDPLHLRHALTALLHPGVSGTLDTLLTAYRNRLAQRRTLLLLDDAADASQVLPLLGQAPDCVTVITSRDPLVDLEERHGALRLELGPLRPAEALELLAAAVSGSSEDLTKLAASCGHEPLALRVAMGQLTDPGGPGLQDYLAAVRDHRRPIELAYEDLPSAARHLFHMLSSIPGTDFTAPAAAALVDVPVSEAQPLLTLLAGGQFLQRREGDRYALHDVLRLFGQQLPNESGVRQEALRRLAEFYGSMTIAAVRRIFPDLHMLLPDEDRCVVEFDSDQDASAWLEAERQNVIAVAAAVEDLVMTRYLANALRALHQVRPHGLDWTPIAESALREASKPTERAAMLVAAGLASWGIGELNVTADRLGEALGLYRQLRLPRERAFALQLLGAVEHTLGRLHRAHDHCAEALRLRRRFDERRAQSSTLVFLSDICADLGKLDRAARYASEALVLAEGTGYAAGSVGALGSLGRVRAEQGRPDEAYLLYLRQLALAQEQSFGSREAIALVGLARLAHHRGHHEQAITQAAEAASIANDAGNPAATVDAWNVAGAACLARGRSSEAVARHRSALTLAEQASYGRGKVEALLGLANALRTHDAEAAVTHARRAVESARASEADQHAALPHRGRTHH
jgi:tetratricopeptide (TPR) repeat protein